MDLGVLPEKLAKGVCTYCDSLFFFADRHRASKGDKSKVKFSPYILPIGATWPEVEGMVDSVTGYALPHKKPQELSRKFVGLVLDTEPIIQLGRAGKER